MSDGNPSCENKEELIREIEWRLKQNQSNTNNKITDSIKYYTDRVEKTFEPDHIANNNNNINDKIYIEKIYIYIKKNEIENFGWRIRGMKALKRLSHYRMLFSILFIIFYFSTF